MAKKAKRVSLRRKWLEFLLEPKTFFKWVLPIVGALFLYAYYWINPQSFAQSMNTIGLIVLVIFALRMIVSFGSGSNRGH